MSSAPSTVIRPGFKPNISSTRQYIGAWSTLSVLQYFLAETAVIAAWAGPEPYDRRTGYISDLGALYCGVYDGRDVCSPLHPLMNTSFFIQGLALVLGALLLTSGLLCVAAAPRSRLPAKRHRGPWPAAIAVRILTGIAGVGTMVVALVPEDAGSPLHYVGAVMFFLGGAAALVILGLLWSRRTPWSWVLLACGLVALVAVVVGGVTGLDVPQPGTLERFMGYPVTLGFACAGMVIARQIRRNRQA